MTTFLALRPRDPVVVRDGRPFGAESGRRMKSLGWPPPSVLAGTVRTALGRHLGREFDDRLISELKAVEVAGPFPAAGGRLFLPAPADAAARGGRAWAMRPEPAGAGGTDLPPGLRPVCPPDGVPDGKYEPPPAWWSADDVAAWLADPTPVVASFADPTRYLPAAAVEERTHLEIDPDTLAAKDGLLFSTAGLALDPFPPTPAEPGRLTARVRGGALAPHVAALSALRPFGGERRLVDLGRDPTPPSWECPAAVGAALAAVRPGGGVRMVLATPAEFAGGWRPGWLTAEGGRVGTPPGAPGSLRLRLVGVANERPQAVSGWDYDKNHPKPVRRLVPAGAVYFFEAAGGDPAALAGRWLEPVSDPAPARTDGFGLAVWGVWAAGGDA